MIRPPLISACRELRWRRRTSTGTIALMLEKNPGRTQAQIKACLEQSARKDANTGLVPNHDWGAGKMDSAKAVKCVP